MDTDCIERGLYSYNVGFGFGAVVLCITEGLVFCIVVQFK